VHPILVSCSCGGEIILWDLSSPTGGHTYTNFPNFSIIVRPRCRHFASIAHRAARARDISTSTANPPSRDALPGGKSKHPSAYIPPARPPARLHLKRPHDPFLGARATRQRCLCLCPGRPLSPRLRDLTTAGTARQRTTMMHSQCPASAAQPPSWTPVGAVRGGIRPRRRAARTAEWAPAQTTTTCLGWVMADAGSEAGVGLWLTLGVVGIDVVCRCGG